MSMTKMGRPTKYKKEFIKEAEKYLQECENARKVPFLEEFASRIGVSTDSVKRWTEANKDFCWAIERIKDYHEMIETSKIQHEGSVSKPLNIIFTDVATWKRAKDNGQE